MHIDKKYIPNKIGRTKSSFTSADIEACDDMYLRKEMKEHVQRIENFLEEVKQRGGISNLAQQPNTHELLQSRKTGLNNFQKSLKHMSEGKGLLSDPLMLRAVMKDMNYSLDVLLGIKKSPVQSFELTMSSGSVEVIQKAVYNALHPEENTKKQAGFPKKIIGAYALLTLTDLFIHNSSNYRKALEILFIGFSRHDRRLFPHLRKSTMITIDTLCRGYFNEIGIQEEYELSGRLLLLAYILYMISCIVTDLIRYTRQNKNSNIAVYRGFTYLEREEVSQLERIIPDINKTFFKIVSDFCVTRNLYSIEQISNSIEHAREVLNDILKFELISEQKDATDQISGDEIFAILVGMRINNKPYLGSIQRSDFVKTMTDLLALIEEIQKFPCEEPSKNREVQLFVHRLSKSENENKPRNGRSWDSPFESLDKAIELAKQISTNEKPVLIFISQGYYEVHEKPITLPSNVHLQGGWVHEGNKWICKERIETVLYSKTKKTLLNCNSTTNLTIENLMLVFPGEIPSSLGCLFSTSVYQNPKSSPIMKDYSLMKLGEMTFPIHSFWANNLIIKKCQISAFVVPNDHLILYNLCSDYQLSDITFTTMTQTDFNTILQSADRKTMDF